MIIERLIFAIVVLGVGFVLYHLWVQHQLRLAGFAVPSDPLLQGRDMTTPTIVYFTTPTCAPCKLQVTPMLQMLQQEMGNTLQVVRVDATEHPDTAQRWGVFSVPTTFVLDKQGQPRKVHNGVVTLETLKRDIQSV